MKLSEKESLILCAIENRANAPLSKIARLTGLKEHAVRYHLQYLVERGVILSRAPLIDSSRLGFDDYSIYLELSSQSHARRQAMLEALARADGVAWIAEVGGEFQYGIQISVRSIRDVRKLFDAWSRKFGNPVHKKSVAAILRFSIFGRKYLGSVDPAPIVFSAGAGKEKYDDTDERILKNMTVRNYGSERELARKLGMPAATLARRVQALEERGIIPGYIYRLDPEKLGRQRLKLQVFTRGLNSEFNDAFYKFCRAHPNVVNLIEFFGPWDFELGIEIAGQDEYTRLQREIFQRFGEHIASLTSFPFFKALHFSTYPYR